MKKLALAFAALALVACGRPPVNCKIQVAPLSVKPVVLRDLRVFSFTTVELGAMLESATFGGTPVPLIFEHGHGPHGGTAAGWLHDCRVDGKGMWCEVDWTPYGAASACLGGWRFISPGMLVDTDEDGTARATSLLEVSLTNIPAIDGMAPVEVPPCPIPFLARGGFGLPRRFSGV